MGDLRIGIASLLFLKERGMPGARLPMRKIRDVLRLSAAGLSKRKIATSLGISATAAGDCLRRAGRAGVVWPLPEGLTDEALERRLYPPSALAAKESRPRPDWAAIHRELRRPGVMTDEAARRGRSRTMRSATSLGPCSATPALTSSP